MRSPTVAPGWYTYMGDTSRFWDGTAWTELSAPYLPSPEGWYTHPGSGKRAYWDGHRWKGRAAAEATRLHELQQTPMAASAGTLGPLHRALQSSSMPSVSTQPKRRLWSPGTLSRSRLWWIGGTAAALTALLVSIPLLTPTPARAQEATVEKVVDGDTIDVITADGELKRVRLLNINAPESVKPDSPIECMGPEAAAYTAGLLPAGEQVRLEFDRASEDKYGRTLAAVFLADGRNISTELARAGLGAAVRYGNDGRFASDVESASDEAREEKHGVFADDVGCSLPSTLERLETQSAAVAEATSGLSSTQLTERVATAAVLLEQLDALTPAEGYEIWELYSGSTRAAFESRLATLRGNLTSSASNLKTAVDRSVEAEREAAAKLAAEQEAAEKLAAVQRVRDETDRLAAEQAAQAEAEAEAERAAQEQRLREEAEREQENSSSGDSGASTGGGGGYDGYAGCRAYGSGGTSIDEKGRPYDKIPCP